MCRITEWLYPVSLSVLAFVFGFSFTNLFADSAISGMERFSGSSGYIMMWEKSPRTLMQLINIFLCQHWLLFKKTKEVNINNVKYILTFCDLNMKIKFSGMT